MTQPLIIGVHHKTGTLLALEIAKLLAQYISPDKINFEKSITSIPNSYRKLPLSSVLRSIPRSIIAYNLWFEHEIDLQGIKFLHFIRDPFTRIASAYLYHKRGAPSDYVRWVDWPIFEFGGPKSYAELLNILDLNDGLIVEAIRTYPEAMGSARALESASRHIPNDYLPMWLNDFENNSKEALARIFRFMYGQTDNRLSDFIMRASSGNIILKQNSDAIQRGHVTRNDVDRSIIEETIGQSMEIIDLYKNIFKKMEAKLTTNKDTLGLNIPSHQGRSFLTEYDGRPSTGYHIIREIQINIEILMSSPALLEHDKNFWKDACASKIWQSIALSNFGMGHLMMLPFIQRFVSQL